MLSFLNETFVDDERTVMDIDGRVALKSYDLEGVIVDGECYRGRRRRYA